MSSKPMKILIIEDDVNDCNDFLECVKKRKDIEIVDYAVTESQHQIILTIIFGLPIFIIIVGIIVWQVRRRKK